jgi:hypothetical protein
MNEAEIKIRTAKLNAKREAIFKKMEDPEYKMTYDEQKEFVSTWFKYTDTNTILTKYIENSIKSKKNQAFVNKYRDYKAGIFHRKKTVATTTKAADTTTKVAADTKADTYDFSDEELAEALAIIEKEAEDKKNAALRVVSEKSYDVDTDGEDAGGVADIDLDVDSSGEEKQDETIKINLQNMLIKLPSYDVNKTEQEYRREYIKNNNKDGELFTDEEEKEGDGVRSVGGRTQKKKKKRVQNRRRQKTIKNKV